jgi:hypothetical protein
VILDAVADVGVTSRGIWSMAVGPIPGATGIMFGKHLDNQGFLLEGLIYRFQAEREVLRKITVLRKQILHHSNVQ